MDVKVAISGYASRILAATPGIKVLLLDAETTPILSLACTQSTLLQNEVYLTDRIGNPARAAGPAERAPYLQCICLLRPTEENVTLLERELRQARYGRYWLYFTNVLDKGAIERLATADEHELVEEVQEVFMDYAALTNSHWSLALLPTPLTPSLTQRTIALYGDTPSAFNRDGEAYARHVEGLRALLLSLKKRPVVRYERMSSMSRRLGEGLLWGGAEQGNGRGWGESSLSVSASASGAPGMLSQPSSDLWTFRDTARPPLLLLLDRRNDPVTPLLTQWTYQAMVHEMLGITHGRVSLADAPDVRDELREITLAPEQDPFYAAHMYDNFGDLGANLSAYVKDYSSKSATANAARIETVADMKRFIENYPEFRKLGNNVAKHVALVGELSRRVDSEKLLLVSEVEQSLASTENHAGDLRAVQSLVQSPEISAEAKLRVAMLYALRYQKYAGNSIQSVVALLRQNDVADAEMVHIMLNFAGADQRQDDLFANSSFFSRGKSALKGLKGVENVYTQHRPHIVETLDALFKGRLKETSYPFVDGQPTGQSAQKHTDIIIFMVGGTTYEEARFVEQINQQIKAGQIMTPSGPLDPQTQVILGGTCVHNSKSFIEMIKDAAFGFPGTVSSAMTLDTTAHAVPAAPNDPLAAANNLIDNAAPVIQASAEAAREGLFNLFGKVREGVNGVRLA